MPVHRKRVLECERLERLERRCRSVSVAAVSTARFKKKFGFWQNRGFTPLCGGGGVLMCNLLPEIFRKFFQIFQISGAGDAVDVKTPNTSKQGEKDQLPMQLKILVVVLKVKVMQLKILVVVVKVLVTQLTIRMKEDQLPMQLKILVVVLKVKVMQLKILMLVLKVKMQLKILVVVLKVKVMQLKILVVVLKVLVTQLTILVKMQHVLMMQLTMLVVLLKVVSVMAQMQVEVASVGAVQW